jgi:hypothetical protein
MSLLKAQFGTAVTADFEELTWTFEMPETFEVSAGEFAIVPKHKYDLLIYTLEAINGIENRAFGMKDFDVERLKREINIALNGGVD